MSKVIWTAMVMFSIILLVGCSGQKETYIQNTNSSDGHLNLEKSDKQRPKIDSEEEAVIDINSLIKNPERYNNKIICVRGRIVHKSESKTFGSESPLPPHYPPYGIIKISGSGGVSIDVLYFLQGDLIKCKGDVKLLELGITVEVKGQFVGRDFDGKKRIHVTNPNHHYIKKYKEE